MSENNKRRGKGGRANNNSNNNASNQSGNTSTPKDSNTKKEEKNKDKSKASNKLYHDGVRSTNIHTWLKYMNNPDHFETLSLNWASSLISLDENKVKLPPIIGGEPIRPLKDENGNYDAIDMQLFMEQTKQVRNRTTEAAKVFEIIQSKQDSSSIAICKQDPSYEEIYETKDIVMYFKLILRTHLMITANPTYSAIKEIKRAVLFHQLENQSTTDYFDAFTRMMDQVKQAAPSSIILGEEYQSWLLLMGLSNQYSQLKQKYLSEPKQAPTTVLDMKNAIVQHVPLETVASKGKNKSAFGIAATAKAENKGKGKNNKEPPRDCPHCVKHCPDYPNKKHWKDQCPNIDKLIQERYGHNIQSDQAGISDSPTFQSQPPATQSTFNVQAATSQSTIGLGLDQARLNSQRSSNNGIITRINTAIIATINYDESSTEVQAYGTGVHPHKDYVILDPQSQVAIFNREDMVSNIRQSDISLTLHGMGNGSLVVTQVADHPVLGVVWFHPNAAVNVWQMRATEAACNVELLKEYDRELGCNVTKAFLATDRRNGMQYRFNFQDNLYVLDEGRQ